MKRGGGPAARGAWEQDTGEGGTKGGSEELRQKQRWARRNGDSGEAGMGGQRDKKLR